MLVVNVVFPNVSHVSIVLSWQLGTFPFVCASWLPSWPFSCACVFLLHFEFGHSHLFLLSWYVVELNPARFPCLPKHPKLQFQLSLTKLGKMMCLAVQVNYQKSFQVHHSPFERGLGRNSMLRRKKLNVNLNRNAERWQFFLHVTTYDENVTAVC